MFFIQQLINIDDIFADEEHKYVRNTLAEVRKDRGLSQMQLANATGTKQSYINKLEQQKANFTPARLVAFCRVLNCSYTDLLPALETSDAINNAIQENKHLKQELQKIKDIIENL